MPVHGRTLTNAGLFSFGAPSRPRDAANAESSYGTRGPTGAPAASQCPLAGDRSTAVHARVCEWCLQSFLDHNEFDKHLHHGRCRKRQRVNEASAFEGAWRRVQAQQHSLNNPERVENLPRGAAGDENDERGEHVGPALAEPQTAGGPDGENPEPDSGGDGRDASTDYVDDDYVPPEAPGFGDGGSVVGSDGEGGGSEDADGRDRVQPLEVTFLNQHQELPAEGGPAEDDAVDARAARELRDEGPTFKDKAAAVLEHMTQSQVRSLSALARLDGAALTDLLAGDLSSQERIHKHLQDHKLAVGWSRRFRLDAGPRNVYMKGSLRDILVRMLSSFPQDTQETEDLFNHDVWGAGGTQKFKRYGDVLERVHREYPNERPYVLSVILSSDGAKLSSGRRGVHPLYICVAHGFQALRSRTRTLLAELPGYSIGDGPKSVETRQAWHNVLGEVLQPLRDTLRRSASNTVGMRVMFPDGVERRVCVVPTIYPSDTPEQRLMTGTRDCCSRCASRSNLDPRQAPRKWRGGAEDCVETARRRLAGGQTFTSVREYCKEVTCQPVVPALTMFEPFVDVFSMFYPCALHQADLGWSKRLVEYVVAYIKGPKPGRNGSTKALEDMNDGLHRLSNLTPGLHPPTCFTLDPGKSSSANDADKVAKATGKEARVLSICLPYLAARYIPWPSIRENIIRVLVAFLDWSLLRETRNPSTEELDALDAAYKHLLEVYEEVFEEKPDFPKAHSGWHYRELLEDFGDVAVGSTNMFESGHKMMTGRSNYNASTYRRQAVLRALRIETMLLVQPPRPRMRHRTQPTAASGSFLTSVSILDLRNMDFGKLMRLNARERAASNLRLAVCAVPELQLVPLALIEFVHGELVRQGRDDPVAAAQSVLGATCNLAKGVKIEDECGIARASPFDTTPGARTRDAPAPTVGRTWDVEVEVDGVDRLARLVAVVEACSATQPVTTDAIAVVKLFADEDHQGELLPSEGGHGGALPGQRMAWATKWRHCTTRGRTLLHPDVRAVPVRNIVRTVLMHPLGPELDGADDGHLWPGAMLNDNFTQETFLENTYLELIHERL